MQSYAGPAWLKVAPDIQEVEGKSPIMLDRTDRTES